MKPIGSPGVAQRIGIAACVALLAALAANPSRCAGPQGGAIEVVDATRPFLSFWSARHGESEAERERLFLATVVAAHPELFTSEVLGESALSGPPQSRDRMQVVAQYLREVAPYVARMQAISEAIDRELATQVRAFKANFPDYAPAAPIYFTVSLFQFDGGTRTVERRNALLFGIDGIARYHAPDENLAVFFDHELFHLYHDQIRPELAGDDVPLWVSLWKEGLATYVSQQINPGASEAAALMSPTLAARTRPILDAATRELLAHFESRDPKEYAAFFYGKNGRSDLPPRCGYYVGLRVARDLGAGRSLRELAMLHGPQLELAVRQALQGLAQPH